jgi:hypothetical protein
MLQLKQLNSDCLNNQRPSVEPLIFSSIKHQTTPVEKQNLIST